MVLLSTASLSYDAKKDEELECGMVDMILNLCRLEASAGTHAYT